MCAGFTVLMLCEGRPSFSPAWLAGFYLISVVSSFLYLLMSVWFAMQALVASKAYEVRLLTQLVRLPVPSWAQLEGARTYESGFEKSDPKQMFRVPFVMGRQEDIL